MQDWLYFEESFQTSYYFTDYGYSKVLSSDYQQNINAFKKVYKELKISVTPKVHAVFFHVSEFCNLKKMGLGPWSEQASESVHHDFKKTWEHFKVRDTNHPEYGKRLLDAIVMYNSQHL